MNKLTLVEPMSLKPELDNLEKKIKKMKSNKQENGVRSFKVQNDGWRMVIELVVGLLVGLGIGLGLDIFLNTKPLFLIIFTLLGFIAGVKTMLKTAKTMKRETLEGRNL